MFARTSLADLNVSVPKVSEERPEVEDALVSYTPVASMPRNYLLSKSVDGMLVLKLLINSQRLVDELLYMRLFNKSLFNETKYFLIKIDVRFLYVLF